MRATSSASVSASGLAVSSRAAPPAAGDTDSLGCRASKLQGSHSLAADGIQFHRKIVADARPGAVATPANGRGFLVGIAMGEGHRRRIHHTQHSSSHDFDRGAIYIRDFSERYRADLESAFDFLLVEVSPAVLARAGDERRGRIVSGLKGVTAERDPVLFNLASAIAPTLSRPAEASKLFVDQMGVVFSTYLMEQYGGARPADGRRRLLSRELESRAKDMLSGHLRGDVSIGEIAQACGLSRSYFIMAFRETTGQTPHQWLVAERVRRARSLLRDATMPLVEIAQACGFADQSHFSRVFTRAVGAPPGQWRRKLDDA